MDDLVMCFTNSKLHNKVLMATIGILLLPLTLIFIWGLLRDEGSMSNIRMINRLREM